MSTKFEVSDIDIEVTSKPQPFDILVCGLCGSKCTRVNLLRHQRTNRCKNMWGIYFYLKSNSI